MGTLHFKSGALYLGDPAVPIGEAAEAMLEIEFDVADDSAFADAWETRLKGALRWAGAAQANFDTASSQLYDVAVSSTLSRLYLYPDRAVSGQFYSGRCWPKLTIDGSRADAGRLTVAFKGSGALASWPHYDESGLPRCYDDLIPRSDALHSWRLTETDLNVTGRNVNDFGSGDRDGTTFGNTLTALAGPSVSGVACPGIVGAWRSNGASYITLGQAAMLGGRSEFTVEAWLRSNATGQRGAVGAGQSSGSLLFWDIQQLNATTLLAEFKDSGAVWRDVSYTSWALNTWFHVAATCTAGTLRLYINGVLVDSDTGPATMADDGNCEHEIFRVGSAGSGWSGDITRVAVYPTALSAATLAGHYAAGVT